jgi:hypothetical protein
LHTAGKIVLDSVALLITAGGLYDLLVFRLPSNLAQASADNQAATRVIRELLRALGGSLVAIGLGVALIVNSNSIPENLVRWLVLLLVLPSEGINSVAMNSAGSPYYVPAGLVVLTIIGVLLA